MFGELHHAVLHDIKGRLIVSHVINRAFKSSFFNALQKVREFFFGGHSKKYRV